MSDAGVRQGGVAEEQFFCPFESHVWKEEYYGYHCTKCDAFIPYGSEPWLPTSDEDEDDCT